MRTPDSEKAKEALPTFHQVVPNEFKRFIHITDVKPDSFYPDAMPDWKRM
jgi:hypothetical protein